MGIIIFFSLSIIEIILATYRIITKSKIIMTRSIFRIVSFLIFIVLVIVSVVEWSPAYYLIALYLLILAIFGAYDIRRRNKDKSNTGTIKLVLFTLVLIIFIFISTIPIILFPQEKIEIETTGRYRYLTRKYTYIDEDRLEGYDADGEKRKLNIQLWYPDSQDNKYPLIVFSHGGLGVKTSNETLFKELASHGYVVCSIDHTYQCFYTEDDNGLVTFIDLGYLKEIFKEDAQTSPRSSYESYKKWMSIRMGDMDFVIDKIIKESKEKDGETGLDLVDTEKIGIVGHSLGGSAALGIGRARDDIDAVIALESPFMYDIEGVRNNQFIFTDEKYPVPLLNVYSDSSWDILDKRPQYKTNYEMLSDKDENTYNIHLTGVGHLGLTDFALTSPILTNFLDRGKSSSSSTVSILKRINKECLKFFNKYLK